MYIGGKMVSCGLKTLGCKCVAGDGYIVGMNVDD